MRLRYMWFVAGWFFIVFVAGCAAPHSSTLLRETPTASADTHTAESEPSPTNQVYAGYEAFLQAKPVEDCWENAMTQQAMNQCAVRQEEASYLKVTQLLKEDVFQTALTGEQREALTQVQDEWEVFRQKDCEWVSDLYRQGTIGPMNYRLCLDQHNRQRLQQLLSTMIPWTGR